jgi:RND family efflux transporter MFP subunit
MLGIVAVIFLGGLLVGVLAVRFHARTTTRAERRDRAARIASGPIVSVIQVATTDPERVSLLPGEVRGYNQVALYPKISGYVTKIAFERGDRVTKGQVLAVIESPETDELVSSAVSDLEAKQINADRAKALATRGAISLFDRDNLSAAARIAEAELRRTSALRGYEIVRAPFDGIATARYVDPGAFLPAATGSTQSAVPIADVADLDQVRVLVYLGQDLALFAEVGDPVAVWERERPNRRVSASITRCGNALDPRTRTMTCEIVIDNRTSDLHPGSFVEVELHQRVAPLPVIPNEAVMIRSGEPLVAVIDANRVHLQSITVGDTDGRTVRVERGLRGGETIGVNVPIEVDEGTVVRPIARPPTPSGAAIGGGPTSSATPPGGSAPPPPRTPGDLGSRDGGRTPIDTGAPDAG